VVRLSLEDFSARYWMLEEHQAIMPLWRFVVNKGRHVFRRRNKYVPRHLADQTGEKILVENEIDPVTNQDPTSRIEVESNES
jgi:hypothetical protein